MSLYMVIMKVSDLSFGHSNEVIDERYVFASRSRIFSNREKAEEYLATVSQAGDPLVLQIDYFPLIGLIQALVRQLEDL